MRDDRFIGAYPKIPAYYTRTERLCQQAKSDLEPLFGIYPLGIDMKTYM